MAFISNHETMDQSRNSELYIQNSSMSPKLDMTELESDEGSMDSPSGKIRRTQKSSRKKKFKNNLEREAIGYIDDNYHFILPDLDLEEKTEDKYLGFDKINLFKTFGLSTPSQQPLEKMVAVQIVKEIVNKEIQKYDKDPHMKSLVQKILGQNELIH